MPVCAMAIEAGGAGDGHRLRGAVTVLAVLALCLFRRENYDLVLARVFASTSMVRAVDGVPPSGQALSQARTRLTGEPLQALFTQIAAAVDSAGVSEQALVDQLAADLRPGMLNLADRNFFAMHRWVRFTATGAQLAWRVKNGARSLPARVVQVLPDGSARVLLHESDQMLAARRRRAGDRSLVRLPDTIARLVEFTVTVTDRRGRATTSRFRVLTTLLDHHRYPAGQIAAAYAHRWQAEVAYLHLKVTLRGAGTRLRGQSPHLARQEIWGLLIVYNALVDLATRA